MERNLSKLSVSEKREYLAKLLSQYAEESPQIHPLSFGQESLWYIHQIDPNSAAYNLLLPIRIKSGIDKRILQLAVETLVARHSILRASFKTDRGHSYQMINDKLDVIIEEVDFSHEAETDFYYRIMQLGQRPFDLSGGTVFKVYLINGNNNDSILVFVVHHIVSDFWSLKILLEELITLYQGNLTNNPITLPALKIEYSDFCKWQRSMVKGTEGERLLTFWKRELADAPFILDLPADKPHSANFSLSGALYPLRIDEERVVKLNELSKSYGVTIFTTTLSIFQLLIHLWCRQDDFVVGCPTSGRTKPEFEQLFGYFVNSVVVRANFKEEQSFSNFLKSQQQRMVNVLNHQAYPFQQLVQQLNPRRNPFRTPIFQVSFQCDKIDFMRRTQGDALTESGLLEQSSKATQFLDISYKIKAEGLQLEYLDIPQTVGQFDLMFRLFNTGQTIGGTIDYNTDIFEEKTIALLARNYIMLLDIILSDPQVLLTDPRLLQLFGSRKEVYWKNKLKNIVPLNFPTDFSRHNASKCHAKSVHSILIDRDLSDDLQIFSRKKNCTLNTILLSVLKVLLYRYCNQEDIWLKGHETENGDLVTYTKLTPGQKMTELIDQVAGEIRESTEHNLPWNEISELLKQNKNYSHDEISRIILFFESNNTAFGQNTTSSTQPVSEDNSDLFIHIKSTTEGLLLTIDYNTALFLPETIKRMAGHYEQLMEATVATPASEVIALQMLSTNEKEQVLIHFNNTRAAFPDNKTIIDYFEEQVKKSPDAIAVEFEKENLSYHALDFKSNQLAHYLRASGVKEETLVAICIPRSLEMMIGILGILKAGAAYVPVDPEYPQARINYLLEDTNTPFVITDYAGQIIEKPECVQKVIGLKSDSDTIDTYPGTALVTQLKSNHLAYVIYTSGSTGRPKGVMNEHKGVVNEILWTQDHFRLTDKDNILQQTTFCFDVSVSELLWPLLFGAKLIFAKPGVYKDVNYIKQIIEERSITVLHFVPSMLDVFLSTIQEEGSCPSIKRVLCNGESLLPSHINAFKKKLPHARLHNLYGPTEAAIAVSCWDVPAETTEVSQVTIGRPISNTQLYVLNNNQIVPVGVPGELHIGGIQVARGYLNKPGLTAEKFLPDPFQKEAGMKLYKTGDLVKWLPDGNLEHLGRLDNQVKLRGVRLEPGEIEAEIRQFDFISNCVVLIKEIKGQKHLIAYVVPKKQFNQKQLKEYLLLRLPAYMIPSFFIKVPDIPLFPNGKIDKKSLAALDDFASSQEIEAPQTETEKQMTAIWKEVLGLEEIGIHNDYFHIGGHSLLVIPLLERMKTFFGMDIPLPVFLQIPNIHQLSNYISDPAKELEEEMVDLETEATLESNIRWDGSPYDHSVKPKSIFVTGSTGYLGAHLIHGLLSHTDAHIHCLVRASSPEEGNSRITGVLKKYDLWQPAFSARIISVPGDISLDRLGLDEKIFDQLAQTIDIIYHSGAQVNFIKSYRHLKKPNVGGTIEILKLACLGKIKMLHYMSTVSIVTDFDTPVDELSQTENQKHNVYNGYGASKWVAEKLVMKAIERGIPCNIYRLGQIIAHSETGICNTDDLFYRLLRGFLQLNCYPYELYKRGITGLTPIDYIVSSLLFLSLEKKIWGKTYHLTNSKELEWDAFFKVISQFSPTIRPVSLNECIILAGRDVLNNPDSPFREIIGLFSEKSIDKLFHFPKIDDRSTLKTLSEKDINRPVLNEDFFEKNLLFLTNASVVTV
jgi:amino acid adenylation domain-containing protein/thioester reductase-like protein